MRNPYTHFVVGLGDRSYMRRIVNTKLAPEDLVLIDAQFAIRAVADYLRHGSPDWNPGKVKWDEADGLTTRTVAPDTHN